MNFFRFFPDCHYVSGPVRGVIYHLGENRTLHLSEVETSIVNAWLGNENISETEVQYGSKATELLDFFIREGIGTTFENPVYTEPYEPSFTYKQDKLFEKVLDLRLAYLEINSQCNAQCNFCGNPNYLNTNGCNSCLKWPVSSGEKSPAPGQNPNSNHRLTKDDYKTIIKQLADLETQGLVFSGGNPLLNWDTVAELIETAIQCRPAFRSLIHTNGFGFSDKLAYDAKWLDIEFLFTVFSNSRAGYQKITGSGELFDSLLAAIDLCKENSIPYRINLLICPDSWPDYSDILQFTKTLGGSFVHNSEVITRFNRTEPLASLPFGAEQGEKFFQTILPQDFFTSKYFSRCLSGKVAVSEKGQILPCPMWDEPIGQMPEDDIRSVLRDLKLQRLWKMSKEAAPICKECEFKFVCYDCTLTEKYRSRYPALQDLVCTYQPELGKWRESEAPITMVRK